MAENENINFTSTAGGGTEEPGLAEKRGSGETPELTFSTLIMSLSGSADLHLGDMPDPTTGKRALNLPLAKQTIEILSMLKGKTEGNLTKDENSLIDSILYELRMKYSKAAKS